MNLDFTSYPTKELKGSITIPGDKSISHRAFILGAIADGITMVSGFLESKDCFATLNALQSMGVVVEKCTDGILIHGRGKYGLQDPHKPIDCGNSGTSMRLLAGLLAAQPFDSILVGDDSLHNRPMERICQPLRCMGADITASSGKAPLYIKGGSRLKGMKYTLPEASAQVKSCLLLAGMYAEGQTTIIELVPTRDHTERMLADFKYPCFVEGSTIKINSDSMGLATEIEIPGDISSAAFFMVAATLIPGSNIILKNVGVNPTRTGIITILKAMGAKIEIDLLEIKNQQELSADIHVQYASLQGIEIDPSLVSLAIDEFPIIFIAAACAEGKTRLSNATELRYKESDRITSMVVGLEQLGIKVQSFEGGLEIQGGKLQGGIVDSFADHRVAMAFAIAGAVSEEAITITNANNIATSFPTFIDLANGLGFTIKPQYQGIRL